MSNVSQINVGNNTYDIKDTTARSGLANKQDIIQITTLPAASLTEEGNIYQYIGETGNGLTNGYFYKCVENSGVYSWIRINVQPSSGGSSVQSDWNQTDTTADDYIKNKPTIPDNGSQISMTGYSKPSATSAIIPSDTVNTAIGKLEKGLEEAGGSGEYEGHKIEIYRSTDFSPITYTYGNTTYYYPRVTLPGTSSGKILAIKAIDANGGTRSFDPNWLMHFGMNLFSPMYTEGSYSSYKPSKVFVEKGSSGVTVTYLGDGGYRVTGTATSNSYMKIGTVIDPVVGVWSRSFNGYKLPLDALNPYIRCVNIQGDTDGLTIGGYYTDTSDVQYLYPLNQEVPLSRKENWYYTTGSSSSKTPYTYRIYYDICLRWETGKTYDCTFYPQIVPKAINSTYSLYEKPFCLNDPALMTMPIKEREGLGESLYTYVTKSSTYVTAVNTYLSMGASSLEFNSAYNYATSNVGNASCFGVIDYPIVHSGLNTFTYGWPVTNENKLLRLEVYYAPDYQRKVKDEIDEIEYSISDGHFNKYIISGNWRMDQGGGSSSSRTDTNHYWLESLKPCMYNSPYIPKGLYFSIDAYVDYTWRKTTSPESISNTDGQEIVYGNKKTMMRDLFLTSDYSDNGYASLHPDSVAYRKIYYPSSDFYWSTYNGGYNYTCFGLPSPGSTGTSFTEYVKIILDYDGWDDSPSFTQRGD